MPLLPSRNNMSADTKHQVSRLFSTLEYGEILAHDCARKQAGLVGNPGLSRFLTLQSQQEAFHAKFFHKATDYLGGTSPGALPDSLRVFRRKLESALQRNDLTETVVGQQVVLESFGGSILARLNHGLDNQGIGFRKLRRLLLRQEQSHQAFGDEILCKQITATETSIEKIQSLSAEYLLLVEKIIDEMSDVFICLEEYPDEYKASVYQGLPHWLDVATA